MLKDRIYFADKRRKNEIDDLRMKAYKHVSGFSVDITTLTWNRSDDESYVMVAETDGQLISTMRGEVIADLAFLEHKLECPWNFSFTLDMPILLLSRAATLSAYRTIGLNLMLRYWFLHFAIHHEIRFVIGTFVSGSPRENTLREMGYHFFENKIGWQKSTYRSLHSVIVAVLDLRTHGNHALEYCLNHLPNKMSTYHFDEKFSTLRLIRNL